MSLRIEKRGEKITHIIRDFNDDQWTEFVRDYLGLEDDCIEEIESRPSRFSEKKYQAVRKWMELEPNNTVEILREMRDKFFNKAPLENDAQQRPTGDSSSPEAYQLTENKGYVLIISNGFEKKGDLVRPDASKNDVDMMVKLWRDNLGCKLFQDKAHVNQSAEQMEKLLKDFSQGQENYDFIVVIISTHGSLLPGKDPLVQVFLGEDGYPVREDEIKKLFYNDKAAGLRHVPKFFILNYCRGDRFDHGAASMTSPPNSDPIGKLMPTVSDILVLYATHDAYVAFNEKNGSWLIRAMSSVFGRYAREKHVLDMLTLVNNEMKQKEAGSYKAMSVFESSLVKDFYLCGNNQSV